MCACVCLQECKRDTCECKKEWMRIAVCRSELQCVAVDRHDHNSRRVVAESTALTALYAWCVCLFVCVCVGERERARVSMCCSVL